MIYHYIYYAIKKDGKSKVGATVNIKNRVRSGYYKECIILEAYTCEWETGDREWELQKKYFGERDSRYHYGQQYQDSKKRIAKSIESRRKKNIWPSNKVKKSDIRRGHKTRVENQLKTSFIFRGKDNGYEPPKAKIPHLEKKSVGVNHQDSKLNPDKVREIRKRYARGNDTYQSIATDYDVTPGTITKVIKRSSWKHVI